MCHDILTNFHKIGSGIQKLIGDSQTHRQHGDIIAHFYFFLKIWKVN
jgi:hypothetical protein